MSVCMGAAGASLCSQLGLISYLNCVTSMCTRQSWGDTLICTVVLSPVAIGSFSNKLFIQYVTFRRDSGSMWPWHQVPIQAITNIMLLYYKGDFK